MYDDVKLLPPVIYFYIILKLGHKVYNWIGTLLLTSIKTYII